MKKMEKGDESIMYNKVELKYKGIIEIEIPWPTRFYYDKKKNIITRFDSAYLLLWEQRHADQRFNRKGDLK